MGENAARENFSFIVKTIIILSSCKSFIIITLVFKFTHSTPIHKQQCFTMPVIKPTAKDNRKPWFENRDLARRGHSCKHWFEKVPKKQHVRNRVFLFVFFEWGPKSTRTVYSLGWNKQCFHILWAVLPLGIYIYI